MNVKPPTTPQREMWVMVLKDEPSDHHHAPADVRLRQLLKRMLRTHGIRCTSIGPAERGEPPPP